MADYSTTLSPEVRAFLTAEWRHLLMLNYAVEPKLLRAHVPSGTELDVWNGTTYLSVVGFLFLHTRVLGWSIPGHRDFEEVNLRFYVRRRTPDGWRRGVVFLKEIVPRRAVAAIARWCFNEPYQTLPMSHRVDLDQGRLRSGSCVEYAWRHRGRWNRLHARIESAAQPLEEGSDAQFITEHFWGYSAQPRGGTVEYEVAHAPWRVAPVSEARLDCDVAGVYGEKYVDALEAPQRSAFVAEGSPVIVGAGIRIAGHRSNA